ncbi:MAG: DUF5703 domain-containing protein [Opitutales bacterium]
MAFTPPIVRWADPSPTSAESMPLGNGETAVNVWTEPNGDVVFYLARTDAWDRFGYLLKVGRVRISITRKDGEPLFGVEDAQCWQQALNTGTGTYDLTTGDAWLSLWVDAGHSCIHVEIAGLEPVRVTARAEVWRTGERDLEGKERHSHHTDAPYRVFRGADTRLAADPGDPAVGAFHHNPTSSWRPNLEQQGLGGFADQADDPLLYRTFGYRIDGPGFEREDDQTLVCLAEDGDATLRVTTHCSIQPDPAAWMAELSEVAQSCPQAADEEARDDHMDWWDTFWSRSHIDIGGNGAARTIGTSYNLQRYLGACAGRGAYPIKFNGSLFTADWGYEAEPFDADYRRWGGGYWHQNTRLAYWPMLAAGDFEQSHPYFRMYRDMLPLARFRTQTYFGHEGAYFPETVYFWGAYLEHNYGWPEERAGLHPGESVNPYIRWHFSSGLEIVWHAYLFYQYVGEDAFAEDTLLPLADGVLGWYDRHFPREADGTLRFEPAQAIEQWHEAINPLAEIAGITRVCRSLLALPESLTSDEQRATWRRLLEELPPIPEQPGKDGEPVFAPAHEVMGPPKNFENPELYGIFPYRLHGLTGDKLETARRSFRRRVHTHDRGWAQDGMQAALLGLTEDARRSVTDRLTVPSAYARFPVFWGPGFDWIPDQDQGGSATAALQFMLLQVDLEQKRLRVFPAWPPEWPVSFKLRGPGGMVVTGRYAPGEDPDIEIEGGPGGYTVINGFAADDAAAAD